MTGSHFTYCTFGPSRKTKSNSSERVGSTSAASPTMRRALSSTPAAAKLAAASRAKEAFFSMVVRRAWGQASSRAMPEAPVAVPISRMFFAPQATACTRTNCRVSSQDTGTCLWKAARRIDETSGPTLRTFMPPVREGRSGTEVSKWG